MKLAKHISVAFATLLAGTMLISCGGDEPNATPGPTAPPASSDNPAETPSDEPGAPIKVNFAKGADVSWLTQLESEGYSFRSAEGVPKECMTLLKEDCGVNSIRLRVWVNPADGWCNKQDVLVKARRAQNLGLASMIDFHFSDSWADPDSQTIPSAWSRNDADAVKRAIRTHVTDVLSALKAEGIAPQWVQIGNETSNGMLWPLGQLDVAGNHFAEFVTEGHDAVKSVFPDALTIVHTDQGDNPYRYDWVYGELKRKGARYDMIGVSFYPELEWNSGWMDMTESEKVSRTVENLRQAKADYGKDAIIVEFGMNYDRPEATRSILGQLMRESAATDFIKGVFYWEPEAPAGYNGGYFKGCFAGGAPTVALEPFTH